MMDAKTANALVTMQAAYDLDCAINPAAVPLWFLPKRDQRIIERAFDMAAEMAWHIDAQTDIPARAWWQPWRTLTEALHLRKNIETRNRLVVENRGLVFKVANHYVRYLRDNATSIEDLEQIGMVGLIVAAERFGPTRGWRFSTYAMYWIRQHIQRATVTAGGIRQNADPKFKAVKPHAIFDNEVRRRAIASFDEPLPGGDGLPLTLYDVTAARENTEIEAFEHLEAERILAAMPEHHAALVRAWLEKGGTRREISVECGYSRSMMQHVLNQAKQREMEANS